MVNYTYYGVICQEILRRKDRIYSCVSLWKSLLFSLESVFKDGASAKKRRSSLKIDGKQERTRKRVLEGHRPACGGEGDMTKNLESNFTWTKGGLFGKMRKYYDNPGNQEHCAQIAAVPDGKPLLNKEELKQVDAQAKYPCHYI